MNLDLRQDGQEGGSDAEEHVDTDEDLVLGATIRVGVVHVEHGQSHHRQQVVDRRDRQQSCEHTHTHIQTPSLEHVSGCCMSSKTRQGTSMSKQDRDFLPGAPFWLVWRYSRTYLSALQPCFGSKSTRKRHNFLPLSAQPGHLQMLPPSKILNVYRYSLPPRSGTFTDTPSQIQNIYRRSLPSRSGTFTDAPSLPDLELLHLSN